MLSWWEQRDAGNILFLKYEDLKKDTFGVVKRISKFLGIELSLEKIHEILEKVQFQI